MQSPPKGWTYVELSSSCKGYYHPRTATFVWSKPIVMEPEDIFVCKETIIMMDM